MRISDYIEQSFANLLKKKLRTFLTTFGVVIGIGALVSMFAFGKGMQKNVTGTFEEMDLFDYMSVYPRSERAAGPSDPNSADNSGQQIRLLDDEFLSELTEIDGVEWAFPEIRFPALVRFGEKEEFTLVQALPAKICRAGYIKLRAGAFYSSDEEHCLIVSDSFLRRMNIKKPQTVIGQELELSTLTVDFSLSNIANVMSHKSTCQSLHRQTGSPPDGLLQLSMVALCRSCGVFGSGQPPRRCLSHIAGRPRGPGCGTAA